MTEKIALFYLLTKRFCPIISMMNDKDKKDNKVEAPTPGGVGVPTDSVGKEEGQELCPKCGNLMVKEGRESVCSSCSDDLDFFGEDEEPKDGE